MKKAGFAAILAACALWYSFANVVQAARLVAISPSDFIHYHRAASLLLQGRSPFAGPDFNYPPLIAILLAPLGWFSYDAARWIWFAFSHACLWTAAWICWRGVGADRAAALSVALVWAFGGAVQENLVLGQAGPPLVLLLAIAFTRSSATRGVAAGAGFALKFIPGILVAALLLRRDRRALAGFALAALLLAALPWTLIATQSRDAAAPNRMDYWMGTPAVLNWSLPAVMLRISDPLTPSGRLPYLWEFGNYLPNFRLQPRPVLLSLGTAIALLAVGLAALAIVSRRRLSSAQMPAAMAGLIALALAASPVCWSHYQILQYPGVAVLLCAALRARAGILTASIALCAALLYTLPVTILRAYVDRYGGWTAASPATLYVWTSVAPLASLALCCLALRQVAGLRGEGGSICS